MKKGKEGKKDERKAKEGKKRRDEEDGMGRQSRVIEIEIHGRRGKRLGMEKGKEGKRDERKRDEEKRKWRKREEVEMERQSRGVEDEL